MTSFPRNPVLVSVLVGDLSSAERPWTGASGAPNAPLLLTSVRHLPIPSAVELAHPPLGLVQVATENGLHRSTGCSSSSSLSQAAGCGRHLDKEAPPPQRAHARCYGTRRDVFCRTWGRTDWTGALGLAGSLYALRCACSTAETLINGCLVRRRR